MSPGTMLHVPDFVGGDVDQWVDTVDTVDTDVIRCPRVACKNTTALSRSPISLRAGHTSTSEESRNFFVENGWTLLRGACGTVHGLGFSEREREPVSRALGGLCIAPGLSRCSPLRLVCPAVWRTDLSGTRRPLPRGPACAVRDVAILP